MKTTFCQACALLVSLAPLTVLNASTGDQDRPVIALNAVQQEVPGQVLGRGASEKQVRESLGEPGQRLARNVWVYFDYEAARPTHNKTDRDALVVTFASGKVVDMRLVDRAAVAVLAAKMQAKPIQAVAEARTTSAQSR